MSHLQRAAGVDFSKARRVVDELARSGEAAEHAMRADWAVLEAAPLSGMLTLRGDLASPQMAAAVQAAAGLPTPATRQAVYAQSAAAYWMSPDELLLRIDYEQAGAAYAAAKDALRGAPSLVTDVSDARQIFELTGPGARETLAKGAPVDMHPSKFVAGQVRRTRIGQVAAMIALAEIEPAEKFEVFCFRSYAAYLQRWLGAAAEPDARAGIFD